MNSGIRINVFGDQDNNIYPLRTNKKDHTNTIDFLLISDSKRQNYCLIKNISRLVSSQYSKHNGQIFICRMCLNPFGRQDILNKHMQICGKNQPVMSHFRKEFRKLLCWWKVSSTINEADSGANRERDRGDKTPERAIPFPESLFPPPRVGKEREQRNPENEVKQTFLWDSQPPNLSPTITFSGILYTKPSPPVVNSETILSANVSDFKNIWSQILQVTYSYFRIILSQYK